MSKDISFTKEEIQEMIEFINKMKEVQAIANDRKAKCNKL